MYNSTDMQRSQGLKNFNDFLGQIMANHPGFDAVGAVKNMTSPETQYQMEQIQKQVDKFKLQNKEREVFGHVISK